ncbi:MAG: hypothetical protein E7051_03435 [Lentisphaerae bacterium]|nr:hypothetical protein [Lentisphaerota bacterium]
MNKNLRSNESGMALVFAIGLLALLLMIGMAFIGNAVNYRRSAENNSGRTQARMFALSAVSRAITSLTLFSQDFAVKNEGKSFPESFDTIYSFAKYKNSDSLSVDASSGEKITDALLTKDSLLTFPLDGSLISKKEAERFNQLFSDGNWPGSWVFFTNGKDGGDKRIIGRAAWQVIGLPADIRASAFLRGYLPMDEKDSDYIPNENRWGREIDEVYLNTADDSPFKGIPTDPGTNPENVKYDTYETLYTALNATDYKKKRWIDRWFLYGTGSMWEPEPYSLEAYSDGYYTLARFNISELSNGVDWKEEYTGDDQWYARFKLASTDFNSENAIKLLTKDSLSNLDGFQDAPKDKNYDSWLLGKDLINGLPFLRRIGNVSGTFADLAGLRKQIAANFNDYCDADSVPTSDVAADKWMSGMWSAAPVYDDGTPFTEPLYTGNEKTPYLYELGMNFGLVSSDSASTVIKAVKQDDGTYAGKFLLQAQIKASPMIKLCNMYDFELGTEYSSLNAYADFGQMDFSFKMKKILIKGVTFKYSVKDDSVPEGKVEKTVTCDILLDELNKPSAGADDLTILNDLLSIKGRNWKKFGAVAGSDKVAPVEFSADDVKNNSGGKPYPTKYSVDGTGNFWQALSNDEALSTTNAFYFDLNKDDLFDAASGAKKNGVELTKSSSDTGSGAVSELEEAVKGEFKSEVAVSVQPTEVEFQEIRVSEIAYNPSRMVLALKPSDPAKSEFGVDFVKKFENRLAWNWVTGYEKILNLVSVGNKIAGFALSGIRNIDPRQNLNKGDWYAAGTEVAELEDFTNPETHLNDSAVIAENKVWNADAINYSSTALTNPQNPRGSDPENVAMDWETAAEPAYKGSGKNDRISTAVIRNAPMMSPWEIGFIHRAAKWQTLNLKSAKSVNFKQHETADSWNEGVAGSSYANGDGAILQQIKMTDRIRSYGKINVNRLRKNAAGFTDYEAGNKAIIQALFAGLQYGEKPADFINNTTRDATTGKFLDETGSPAEISMAGANDIVTTFLADSARKEVSGRHKFIDYATSGGLNLACAFSSTIQSTQETDVAKEELIGKTINLLSADSLSPTVVKILVVAQSIRDVEGTQVRNAGDPSAKYDLSGVAGDTDSASIDSDQIAVKECKLGRFDMTAHKTDHGKNIYFDEITGEVRLFVELHHDTDTGKITVKNIRYL